MRFAVPEISWHNRDPVLSVDFQPRRDKKEPLRLATGGTDTHVVIWYLSISGSGSVNLEVASDLTRHQKAVNVVRWSPNGQLLASGDDESIIFVWKQKTEDQQTPVEGEEQYKESWVIHKTLRGHMEDVLDLSWSMDSLHLASGSVDNKLIIWDVGRGKYTNINTDHKGFVQGVSWDPKGQFIATTSTDRVFRTIDVASKKVNSRSSKAVLPFPKDHPLYDVKVRLYHDDTLQTYYRRPHFSPDGLLIAVPAGRIEPEQGKLDTKPINAVYIYTRYSLKVPVCVVPCGSPALAVRWSRRLAVCAAGPAPALPLPPAPAPPRARHLLAVATARALLLYDTQHTTPLAVLSDLHYTRLTDLTWSDDGLVLVTSSTDGFCSVVMFTEGELGEPLSNDVCEASASSTEMMAVDEPELETKPTEGKSPKVKTNNKLDSFIKFKAPSDKSPKKQMIEKQQKTPVKVDLLVETAMPSWSDNSNSDIIKTNMNNEVTVIEDSEDIKLVYEETEDNLQSPKCKEEEKTKENVGDTEPTQTDELRTKENISGSKSSEVNNSKTEPAKKSPPVFQRAPRRVSFVTLSSPKNKKKC
ncbi:chromatin assembly factor 1 subunit B [Leptidea sinapis]|uniref:chromatin assembly factor 1 subunit B n=1 Tax=Leptidea sinapis TaxID=189913 RepID=UPI0021C3A823|nr:chromatin assembly factor 1 subunit B [Leptidea sinapis]